MVRIRSVHLQRLGFVLDHAGGRPPANPFVPLAGDIVSAACLLEPMSGRTVEAITEVEYRKYRRSDVKAVLFKNADLMDKVAKIWSEERIHFDQMALDLGRRTADERIARLILSLAERLAKRGLQKRRYDGVSAAPTAHRGRYRPDPGACQQSAG